MINQMLLAMKANAVVTYAMPTDVVQSISGDIASVLLVGNGTTAVGIAGSIVSPSLVNWYTPTTASIGTGHWFRVDFNSGTDQMLTVTGTWINIGGGAGVGITYGGSPAWGYYRIRLSTDSGGSTVVFDSFIYMETT